MVMPDSSKSLMKGERMGGEEPDLHRTHTASRLALQHLLLAVYFVGGQGGRFPLFLWGRFLGGSLGLARVGLRAACPSFGRFYQFGEHLLDARRCFVGGDQPSSAKTSGGKRKFRLALSACLLFRAITNSECKRSRA